MLIETHNRNVAGPLSDLLALVYGEVVQALVEAGHIETVADIIAQRVVPRVEDKLVLHGFVSRQIRDDG